MNALSKGMGQAVAYGLFCSVVAYWATDPVYSYLPADRAEIKLAFKHAAQRREKCHKRTHEELMKLAPNMRGANRCSRQRSPLLIELLVDDRPLAKTVYPPPGIHEDGSAYVYEKYRVSLGKHRLTLRMRDTMRTTGYDHRLTQEIVVEAGQALVIGFDGSKNGFVFY